LFALLLCAACSSSPSSDVSNSSPSADTIAPFDDAVGLVGTVSKRLADVLDAADVGKTFGVPDNAVPYPDTYWPMMYGGIDVAWVGDGTVPSPLRKYMMLTNPSALESARSWNAKFHGPERPEVAPWWGLCNGWAGASTVEMPLLHGITVKMQGAEPVLCATAGEAGCTTFEIGDINALLAEIYLDGPSRFIGSRCDTTPDKIVRDEFGRIDRYKNGKGCKGLNPGALLMVMNQVMKRMQKPFVINAQDDSRTEQIWNQPAYRYTVNRFEELSEPQAANLVGNSRREGPHEKYRWNVAAKGFAFVDACLHWVTESGPNTEFVSGLESTRTTCFAAVIELDAPASSPDATILGGEYLDGQGPARSRLTVPPYVWMSQGPGPEELNLSANGHNHNPYLRPSFVRKLAELARTPKPTPQ
jgi:hypothetical protein